MNRMEEAYWAALIEWSRTNDHRSIFWSIAMDRFVSKLMDSVRFSE